jgi:hypothetical protein
VQVVTSSVVRSMHAGVAARGVDCECARASLVAALAAVTVMAQRTVAAVCNRADGKGAEAGIGGGSSSWSARPPVAA